MGRIANEELNFYEDNIANASEIDQAARRAIIDYEDPHTVITELARIIQAALRIKKRNQGRMNGRKGQKKQ